MVAPADRDFDDGHDDDDDDDDGEGARGSCPWAPSQSNYARALIDLTNGGRLLANLIEINGRPAVRSPRTCLI